MSTKHKIFVYGTLRTGATAHLHVVPGLMYDLGSFPGVLLGAPEDGNFIVAESVTVTEEGLKRLDQYEGYYKDDPGASLYIRKPYLDGWIYEYNGVIGSRPLVKNGDWLKYRETECGSATSLIARASAGYEEI